MIKEDFLHYVWHSKKFDLTQLITTDQQLIQILDFGYLNTNSGPDFFNAKIKLDGVIWAGNIEIHVMSSDWLKHKHQIDPAYQNVILHVVLEEDETIRDMNGHVIPCLELKKRIKKSDLSKYKLLLNDQKWIPCENQIFSVTGISKLQAIEKAALHRLESKSGYIESLLLFTNQHWEYTLLIMLFRYFGADVNSEAFESLAKSLSPTLILRESSSLFNLEALLLGQAGMLEAELNDEYYYSLRNRYKFVSTKYSLRSIPVSSWKLMRMRPSSFPTIRISQLASLLHKSNSFFDLIREKSTITELRKTFDGKASSYWDDHYLFNKKSKTLVKRISESFKEILFINVIAPLLHYYGKVRHDTEYITRSVELLEALPFESNRITTKWKTYDMPAKTALESQGLLELRKNFCLNKKCLKCPIGYEIMK